MLHHTFRQGPTVGIADGVPSTYEKKKERETLE